MARASEEFLLAWQSLPKSGTESGWRTIPVTAPSVGCAIRAGRKHPMGQEAVLAGFDHGLLPAVEKLPDGQGFLVERVDMDDGWTWLAMTRSESGQFDLFVAMVCDVVGLLDAASQTDRQTQMRLFIERVRAWQEFMRKGVTALGPEREVGLIGELTVLNGLLDEGLGCSTVIDAWKGPLDGEQDFELGMGAVEVKATVSQTGFPARVGSLQQLDDHIRQPLFLAGVKLRLYPEGFSLPSLVAQPSACKASMDTASLVRFPSSLVRQKSGLEPGTFASLHPAWKCQKQPCTNTTTRCLGSTRSGEPGRSLQCSLNR